MSAFHVVAFIYSIQKKQKFNQHENILLLPFALLRLASTTLKRSVLKSQRQLKSFFNLSAKNEDVCLKRKG